MCTPWQMWWKFTLPVHPVVPFLTEYPSWQWQMKEPLVFSHSPNIQMLEFKSHSFTSVSTHKFIISWMLLSINSIFSLLEYFQWSINIRSTVQPYNMWHLLIFIIIHFSCSILYSFNFLKASKDEHVVQISVFPNLFRMLIISLWG